LFRVYNPQISVWFANFRHRRDPLFPKNWTPKTGRSEVLLRRCEVGTLTLVA